MKVRYGLTARRSVRPYSSLPLPTNFPLSFRSATALSLPLRLPIPPEFVACDRARSRYRLLTRHLFLLCSALRTRRLVLPAPYS